MDGLRRKHERLRYPIDLRPTIEICGIKYKVHDLSLGGVNIIVPQVSAFVLHRALQAQLIVSADNLVEFTGTLSILPPRYTLVFTHSLNIDELKYDTTNAHFGLEVNGFTFNKVDMNNKNIPLFVNELEINTFARMLPPVEGKIFFHDGEELRVEGTIIRVKQRGTAMKFKQLLPPERFTKEMAFVQRSRTNPEVRFGSQLRIRVPRASDELSLD